MGKRRLPPLTPRGREILAYVMNAAAFKTHGNDADLETMAKNLGTTAGRFRPTLRRLEAAGWLTVEGKSLAFVYPTVAAIRQQNPNYTQAQAKSIVQRLKRGRSDS